MRTTLALSDDVLSQAKERAASQNLSLARYVETVLRQQLAESVQEASPEHRPLKTFSGDGLRSSVDLNDSAALANLLDES